MTGLATTKMAVTLAFSRVQTFGHRVALTAMAPVAKAHARYILTAWGSGTYTVPAINWNPGPGLQNGARKLAFILMLVWLVWIIGHHAIPGRSSMGRRVGWGRFMAAGFVCILLMDLTMIPTLINGIIHLGWDIASTIGIVN